MSDTTAESRRERGAYAGLRVLIIDDNRDAALALAAVLKRLGICLMCAYGGPSALSIAGSFVPDVVLLDIEMPGMNGFEVARALRQMPILRKTRIVAHTGSAVIEASLDRAQSDFDDYLPKPANMLNVLGVLLPAHAPATPTAGTSASSGIPKSG